MHIENNMNIPSAPQRRKMCLNNKRHLNKQLLSEKETRDVWQNHAIVEQQTFEGHGIKMISIGTKNRNLI